MSMHLFKTFAAAFILISLLLSCQKAPLESAINKDFRDRLCGRYIGGQQQYFSDSIGNKNIPITEGENRLELRVAPCKNHPEALIINNSVIVYPESVSGTYKELLLIHEKQCKGTESYQLLFEVEQQRLKLIIEKNLICAGNNGRILSTFEGIKVN